MKKSTLFAFMYTPLLFCAGSQFNTDFLKRFGPNSALYNEPLYFATERIHHPPKRKPLKAEKRIKRLRKKMEELKKAASHSSKY